MNDFPEPCPFCGEMPECVEAYDGWHRVDCGNQACTVFCRTTNFESRSEAVAAWNTRQEPSR